MNSSEKKESFKFFDKFSKKDPSEVDVEKAEKKATSLGEKFNDFKLLLEMFNAYRKGEFKISKTDLAIIIGTIIYVVSPIDAIPDLIPVVGFVDDIGIVAFSINKLHNVIEEYKVHKNTKLLK